MLIARGALDDRLPGFRAGAGDYLLKPLARARHGLTENLHGL